MHHSFYKLKRNQKGASHILVVLAVIVAGVVGFTGYRLQQMSSADTVNFGTTTAASTAENLNANYKISSVYSPVSGGKVTQMSLYLDGKASNSGSGTVRTSIYADENGKPGKLLGYSAVKSIPAGKTAGWVTFDFGIPVWVSSGTKYWLGASAGDKTVVRIYRGTTANAKVWGANAGGAIPTDTYGTANVAAGPLSVYATYTSSSTSTPATPSTPTEPTTPTAPSSPSGVAMPTSAPSGWTRMFDDDFKTDIAAGNFPQAVSQRWGTYNGFVDSSKNGYYNDDIITVANGVLNMNLRTVNGKPQVSAPAPFIHQDGKWDGMAYGRYSVRFKVDDTLKGYAAAWLLWPDTNNWNEGEIDFPEGAFTGNINGFNHCPGNPASNCSYALTKTPFMSGWHTTTVEWKPNSLKFILDDTTVMSTTTNVPTAKMHWVLQTETAYGVIPDPSTTGNVQIDWVTVDKL